MMRTPSSRSIIATTYGTLVLKYGSPDCRTTVNVWTVPSPEPRIQSTRSEPQCGQRGRGCQKVRKHALHFGTSSTPSAALLQNVAPALRVSGKGRDGSRSLAIRLANER